MLYDGGDAAATAEVVLAEDVDVVFLQEVGTARAAFFRDALKDAYPYHGSPPRAPWARLARLREGADGLYRSLVDGAGNVVDSASPSATSPPAMST